MLWVHILVYHLRRLLHREHPFTTDDLEYFIEDDTIDIKQFHCSTGKNFKDRRRELKKRRNWYIRHGLFDWAEDIDTALWAAKQVRLNVDIC